MINYYEVLEISENSSPEVIKAAYRALAKKYHPDSYKGDSKYREEKMSAINIAYDILSDDAKKRKYDAELNLEKNKNQSYQNESHTYAKENNNYRQTTAYANDDFYFKNRNFQDNNYYDYEDDDFYDESTTVPQEKPQLKPWQSLLVATICIGVSTLIDHLLGQNDE